MTKSSLRLAKRSLAVAQTALPTYASRFSRKDFTLHQLFAILVLRKFWKTDYRGAVVQLAEWSDLRRVLRLSKVPRHTTLWTAEQKLTQRGLSISSCPRASLSRVAWA